jgi:hypothetical protein
MKNKTLKTARARVRIPFNTGQRPHKSKKTYTRKNTRVRKEDYS